MAMSDRDKLFIDQYMIDQNGTQSMQRCDPSLSRASASTAAWRALTRFDVREEIDRRIAEQRSRNKLTVTMIEDMLRDLAEVEPLDIWDQDGNVRPLQEMPARARKAIKSIKKVTKEKYISGEEETTLVIELWDKKGAIELLGKYKKMFVDKLEIDGEVRQKVSFAINGIAK